jgi:hypothetical protein
VLAHFEIKVERFCDVTLAEQTIAEEKNEKLLEDLTILEKAVLYKTLYAEGLRITGCDALISARARARIHGDTASRSKVGAPARHATNEGPTVNNYLRMIMGICQVNSVEVNLRGSDFRLWSGKVTHVVLIKSKAPEGVRVIVRLSFE